MTALNLAVVDWNNSSRAELDEVPIDTTVGELLAEVKEAMRLPGATPYSLLHNGQKLSRGQTLQEAGVTADEELTVAPEVSAG